MYLLLPGYHKRKTRVCPFVRAIKSVKGVSCVDQLKSFQRVSNVPNVAQNLPVEVRLHQFRKSFPFRNQPTLTRSPIIISGFVHPLQEQLPDGGITCTHAKERPKIRHFWLSSADCSGSKTKQQMKTYPRSELTEQLSEIREIKNGDTKKLKDSLANRRMGNVHRFQGCLLPYPNKPTVQEMPAFSCPRSILPIQSSTVWSVNCFHGILNGSQGSQTNGSKQGYKNPPVPRRLAGQSHITSLSPAYTDCSSHVPGTTLDSEHGKIRAETPPDLQFRRLPIRP